VVIVIHLIDFKMRKWLETEMLFKKLHHHRKTISGKNQSIIPSNGMIREQASLVILIMVFHETFLKNCKLVSELKLEGYNIGYAANSIIFSNRRK